MRPQQIGHIEILRTRVYPQDPANPNGPEVIVKPGRYPLYRDGVDTFWLMHGRINAPAVDVQSLGGGMFAVHRGDQPSKVKAEFSSRRFAPAEWADLLASPEFTEGDAAQRLRVSIGVSDDTESEVSRAGS